MKRQLFASLAFAVLILFSAVFAIPTPAQADVGAVQQLIAALDPLLVACYVSPASAAELQRAAAFGEISVSDLYSVRANVDSVPRLEIGTPNERPEHLSTYRVRLWRNDTESSTASSYHPPARAV